MDQSSRNDGVEGKNDSSKISPPKEENVPDPDEGDLDDLDDMLDEFSSTNIKENQQASTASEIRPEIQPQPQDNTDLNGEDFNRQLQDQMAALLGSMDESPEMKHEIKAMLEELSATADPGADPTQSAPATGSSGVNDTAGQGTSFQESIRKATERLQASGDQASAAAKSGGEDDMFAQLMKEIQGGASAGPDDEEGFNKMLLGMMEQLTNKEILYEPMKELHDKFPAWLNSNRAKTKAEDLRRYEEQQTLVGEIVGRFERKEYSDEHAADREFIVDRMQKMQAAGSPPPDLVGDMNDALGDFEAGCPQQ